MSWMRVVWKRGSARLGNSLNSLGVVLALLAMLTMDGPWSGLKAGQAPVGAMADASQRLRMGAWNVLKLGHDNGKDYVAVAAVIEGNFDVVALVEVMQKGGTHPGYDQLRRALGRHWDGLVTEEPRPNTNSGSAEFYAVLFRKHRVSVCEGWKGLVYHLDNDGTQSEHENDFFRREPAFVCLQSQHSGKKTGFDFMLAAYHARWTGGKKKIKEEVGRLDDVFQAMSEARPGEKDLIVAGDFNLTPPNMEEALGSRPGMTGEGSTLSASGARTKNIYDYILLHDAEATTEMTGQPTLIDVRGIVVDDATFRDSVSDHLPIVAVFETDGEDDD